eukprot:CAMPEP_0183600224 /NCGR_PEP_ID=MMETSP0371-20130417/179826_1 /TAXON_ID=268820 /ORGANISM="Peridinium aciculiferum, Strain PAER-2" /LENGTH=180 /DNA_ID=CAMNT_0025812297 /DNA_START=61 /DNA_END=604 /DNA_ORIENTATION=-
MARGSSSISRLAVCVAAAALLCRLAGPAFLPAPATGSMQLRGHHAAAAASLATLAAAQPQAAHAAELTFDGFGPGELVAIFVPIIYCWLAYGEWEAKQDPVEDVGVGALGRTVDGTFEEGGYTAYGEWEAKQDPVEDVGVGALGRTVDGTFEEGGYTAARSSTAEPPPPSHRGELLPLTG